MRERGAICECAPNLHEDAVRSAIVQTMKRPLVPWVLIQNDTCLETYPDVRSFPCAGTRRHNEEEMGMAHALQTRSLADRSTPRLADH